MNHCVLCVILMLQFFFFNDTATTEIYTLSLHDALPISRATGSDSAAVFSHSTRWPGPSMRTRSAWPSCQWRQESLRSEEHTSELQSLAYLVCRLLLEKKKENIYTSTIFTPTQSTTRRSL